MKPKENKIEQKFSWFNKNIQQIGLNEEAVNEMLDGVCDELKKHIESIGVSLHNDVTTVQSIVKDSALAILLKIDEGAQQTEEGIKKAVQENFKLLESKLSEQLKNASVVYLEQAKNKNEILDALRKWQNKSRYYAERAEDIYAAVEIVNGFIEESKRVALDDLKFGRYLLSDGRFEEAYKSFEQAMRDPSLSIEAHFYMALARCSIQSVWDDDTMEEVPLIHDIEAAGGLSENADFERAVSTEDNIKKAYYKDFAKQVEIILKEYEKIAEASKSGKYDYDCFICIKQSDMQNSKLDTDDFKWLKEKKLFKILTEDNHIKTFAAYITLETGMPKGSNNYNAFILYALKHSKVLLFICGNSTYAKTPWVMNEYKRFIKFHDNPQIVLVSNEKGLKIPGVTGQIQIFSKDNIYKIVEEVKSKVEQSKGYVQIGRFYCVKCGRSYDFNYGKCIYVDAHKVKCDGDLLPDLEYSNRRNEKLHIKLHDTEKELEQERAKREQAEKNLEQENENRIKAETANEELRDIKKKYENEKSKRINAETVIDSLRKNQPITNEVAATLDELANAKREELIREKDEIKKQLSVAQGRNNALENEQVWLKVKFAYIIIAALAVALGVFAIVSKSYLPLWASILRNCKWLETTIDWVLFFMTIALFVLGTIILANDVDGGTVMYILFATAVVAGFGLVITGTVSLSITGATGESGTDSQILSLSIAIIVFMSVAIGAIVVLCVIGFPKRAFPYIALALCAFCVVAYGFHRVRHTRSEFYMYSPNNASRNLEYDYSLDGECYMVKGMGKCKDTDIVIPEKRFGWKVNAIESSAFKYQIGLTSITLPSSVTSIGSSAFEECDGITSIEIPNAVTFIGDRAFYSCSGLTSIIIPDSVTSIGSYTFYGCSNLTSIDMPSNAKSIGNHSFRGCSNLASIEIPDGVTSIGSSAFDGCSSLTSIIIPNSITNIGDNAFDGCGNLTIYCEAISQPSDWSKQWNSSGCTVIWDCNNVDGIRYKLKDGCATVRGCVSRNIEDITIPASVEIRNETYKVTGIEPSAFYYKTDLKSIVMPNSVTMIGRSAFHGCWSLTSMEMSNTVTSIGDWAFGFCSSLTRVTIPNTVTSIGDCAFDFCSSLTSIIIPDSVTSIGYGAFSNCSNLTIYCEAISQPSGWNAQWTNSNRMVVWNRNNIIDGLWYGFEDGVAAVKKCGGSIKDTITIPDNVEYDNEIFRVTSIGSNAFEGCGSLINVTIPNSVTSIGYGAFDGCNNLSSINYIGDIASWCHISGLSNLMSQSRVLYVNGQPIEGELVIPDGVITINDSTFYNCGGVTSITIPNGVVSIGSHAFNSCSSLTSVEIPNSVMGIDNGAFNYCYGLTNIIFIGTRQEWRSISKPGIWNIDTGNYTVHCTDGDIPKAEDK